MDCISCQPSATRNSTHLFHRTASDVPGKCPHSGYDLKLPRCSEECCAVVTFDQPVFTLAKQIQCKWPEDYGEDKVVVMFGGFHIEMAALKTFGRLAGWEWLGAGTSSS